MIKHKQVKEFVNGDSLAEFFAMYGLQEHLIDFKPLIENLLTADNFRLLDAEIDRSLKTTHVRYYNPWLENFKALIKLAVEFDEAIYKNTDKLPTLKISLFINNAAEGTVELIGFDQLNKMIEFAKDYAFEFGDLIHTDSEIHKFRRKKLLAAGMGNGVSYSDASQIVEKDVLAFAESERDAAVYRAYEKRKKRKKTGRPSSTRWLYRHIWNIHQLLQKTALKSDAKIISQKQAEFIYSLLIFLDILKDEKNAAFEGADYIRTMISNYKRNPKV